MSMKDAVGNGNAAMKEAAMQSLSTEAMQNGHSSTKVGLEPGNIGKETDEQAARAGSTARVKRGQTLGCRGRRRLQGMASSWRVRAAPPWIRQRLWWERVAPPEEKTRSPIACVASAYGDGGVSRSCACSD